MRKLVVFTMFLVLTYVGISALNVNPQSPEYDVWKSSQVYTPEAQVTPTQPSHPFQKVDNQAKDQCELLVPLDDTFTLAMNPNDDGYTSRIDLPFTFMLYGTPYNYCWVNNNGNVTFNRGLSSYTPWGFPISGYPMLAPFFADVDTRGAGAVYYKIEANRMIVIWDHVGYYNRGTDKLNTFELIFSDGTDSQIGLGNNVAFSYSDMAWTTGSASGGSGGFGGSPATVGINKGDNVEYAQIGRFDHAGTDYDGPYGNHDGVDWLDCQLFLFNTGAEVANVAPVFVTVPESPVELTVGDVWSFDVTVIAPEAGQITNATITHSIPMSYNIVPANTLTFTLGVTATSAMIGTNLITITATDDGVPPLSSSYEFEIIVSPDQSGFIYEVNAFDLDWYVGNGYVFPSPVPDFNDSHDLGAEIYRDDVPLGVYTPYIFGLGNNLPFLAGTYSVVCDGYTNWLPESVTFHSITTNYATDFLGYREETTPVELTGFTATFAADNYVNLTWVTQSENNMFGYRVYRSESQEQANLINITPQMIAAGNTTQTQTYNHYDYEVEAGHTYYYWLEAIEFNSSDFFGPVSVTVPGTSGQAPVITPFLSGGPNPFKAGGETNFHFSVKNGETGTLTIYNVLGQVVRTYQVTSGENQLIKWNGRDSRGADCASGIYFYKLDTPSLKDTRKLVIMK
ncbi:MAG: T9SS type A sorting domain-containing protein [Candidatus Cloacimonetes bacterium]|jgi:hypothetical protein|nr:T9SS type A sorting domain-containing protein [Candidatus Cloacimonadota bacterium]